MNRRTALEVLFPAGLAGLAGCTSVFGGDRSRKAVSIRRSDGVPATFDLDIDVELQRAVITPDLPGRLRITVENTGRDPIRIGDGHNRVFSGVVSTDDASDPGLLLVSTEANVHRDPRCWKPAGSPSISTALSFHSLDAGEAASIAYEIWGQSDNDVPDCLPDGDYRFETTYHVRPGDRRFGTGDEATFDWGFELSINTDAAASEG